METGLTTGGSRLWADGLTKIYRGRRVVDDVHVAVQQGEIVGLLGPNGAGKTTAIGIISSLVNKSSGEVEVFGHSIDTDLEAAKACIGVVVTSRKWQLLCKSGVSKWFIMVLCLFRLFTT